ncbi:cofactor assembly of complex C subunit B [Microcoleus sp. FACHB-672]|uniref:cofactor assembly of complex C subunit B n=1 Tax=Microcoleus sp. FACHB-672 TaxID=2692825 RepID=UPI0016896E62|nr:cofactor assembly of complex C subunit B [Microcoleus sp. FACHB-672]MBD2041076.1 cofactor assembly of complex C subunit B [Microcoleus sp. FACHB-672]
MNPPILSSTFLLTLLLAVGLFFFIRASVKDRTEEVKLFSEQAEDSLLSELRQYFSQRAYRVAAVDAAQNQVTFEGYVRPSWFLAIFLTLLAAVGILCLALILSVVFPQIGRVFLGLLLLAPASGYFYWQKAGRTEKVSVKVETAAGVEPGMQSAIAIKAHRDEIAEMQRALPLKIGRD